MTETNIFVYKRFLSLNISDFSFFFVKTVTAPNHEKGHPIFPSKPPLKIEITVKRSPTFWKFSRRFNLPPVERGDAHYAFQHNQDFLYFCSIEIHSTQGWTDTTRHEVTRKKTERWKAYGKVMNIIEIISIITSYLTKFSFIFFMTWMFVGMLCYYQFMLIRTGLWKNAVCQVG